MMQWARWNDGSFRKGMGGGIWLGERVGAADGCSKEGSSSTGASRAVVHGCRPASRRPVRCSAEGDGRTSSLEMLVKRKHKEVAGLLAELGDEGLEERMQSALQNPASPRFRAAQALSAPRLQGLPAVVLELARGPSPGQSTEQLVERALQFERSGPEALPAPIPLPHLTVSALPRTR